MAHLLMINGGSMPVSRTQNRSVSHKGPRHTLPHTHKHTLSHSVVQPVVSEPVMRPQRRSTKKAEGVSKGGLRSHSDNHLASAS